MTKRQRNKLPKLATERDRLRALWSRCAYPPPGAFVFRMTDGKPVNVQAVTRALSRYDHHLASAMLSIASTPLPSNCNDCGAREGRYHIAWMRTALRQAAKLLGVAPGV